MKKAKVGALVVAGALLASIPFSLSACGNYKIAGEIRDLTLNYVVVEENGQHVLHQIDKWSDYSSDSITFSTKCCDNYMWTFTSNVVAYKDKPASSAYDFECNGRD